MKQQEIVIIGGGLAGLTAAIHLASKRYKVKLYEKEAYPHHKVCGEYLSREVLPYLLSLDISLSSLNPVDINQLIFSGASGNTIETTLPLGGIGISRYALDNFLYQTALKKGVQIINQNVTSVKFENELFYITTQFGTTSTGGVVFGAFGKRSTLDKKLNREFIDTKTGWLAVKGHYQIENYPQNTVSLHNFQGGYCGLSKIENGAVNVCYLATYKSFKNYKDPQMYQREVLMKNEHLNSFFSKATPVFNQDYTIAQISFDKKTQVEDHILMLGDSAGLIHPLCGNGMAMAIHSAKLASECVLLHYNSTGLNRSQLEKDYKKLWNQHFRSRLKTGRLLQNILLSNKLSQISQRAIQVFPQLLPAIIKRTHGKPVQ